jgi:hypothetical protein
MEFGVEVKNELGVEVGVRSGVCRIGGDEEYNLGRVEV